MARLSEPLVVVNERRKQPRWEGNILVELEDPSGILFEVVGLNVSTGGLCMIFPDAPEPLVGAVYSVRFRLPNMNEPIDNAVEIRWIDGVRKKLCGGAFVRGMRAREVYSLGKLIELETD